MFSKLPAVLFLLVVCLVNCLSLRSRSRISSRAEQCKLPFLENGRFRVMQRGKVVKYSCSPNFELVGSRYATCSQGEWDEPAPVCVRPGCPQLTIENGVSYSGHSGAWLVFFCFPGRSAVGSLAVYCNGTKWNDTAPVCTSDSQEEANMSCDFEDPNICHWSQDDYHDFDWQRHSLSTPSSFVNTGPSYDHTFGTEKPGHYMYIESTSKMENDTARLISPMYDASLSHDGCFSFYYHMYGRTTGGLRVYQKPETISLEFMLRLVQVNRNYLLFEKWGDQGDFWYNDVLPLNPSPMSQNFQIVIEGIRGSGFTSDIAIDDVAILNKDECKKAIMNVSTPPDVSGDSCMGRCFVNLTKGCGCNNKCFMDSNCCPDFVETCVISYADFPPSSPADYEDSDTTTETPSTVSKPTSPKTTFSTSSTTTQKPVVTTSPKTTSKFTPSSKSLQSTVIPMTKPTTTKRTTNINQTTKSKQTTKVLPTTKVISTTNAISTTKIIPTARNNPTIKVKETKETTTKGKGTILFQTTTIRSQIIKMQKQKVLEIGKLAGENNENKSSSKSLLLSLTGILLIASIVGAVVFLRRPRGRLFMDKMRGRTRKDPEVRYLPSDVDDDE